MLLLYHTMDVDLQREEEFNNYLTERKEWLDIEAQRLKLREDLMTQFSGQVKLCKTKATLQGNTVEVEEKNSLNTLFS